MDTSPRHNSCHPGVFELYKYSVSLENRQWLFRLKFLIMRIYDYMLFKPQSIQEHQMLHQTGISRECIAINEKIQKDY